MESPSGGSTPKKHTRHVSGRAPLVRRSTKGPLDIDDSPLVDPLSPNSSIFITPAQTPQIGSQLLSPTSLTAAQSQFSSTAPQRAPSPRAPAQPRHHTPRLGSPQPSTLSSNLSFKTAHSTLSPRTSGLTQHPTKDFSYLLRPEIYHPLTLLDVPPPFRTAATQPSPSTPLSTLISTGHFRSAAIKAASLLTTTSISPADHAQIFSLVYTRLSSLTLCNATSLAAQEVKALEDLNSSYYRDEETGTHLVPWELRVLAVRLQGMGFNDARRGVMGYYDLAREVRLSLTALKKSLHAPPPSGAGLSDDERTSIEQEIELLSTQLQDLGLRVASALIEMDDLEGAARHLSSLQSSASLSPPPSSNINMQKSLLYLYLGDVDAARSCISTSIDDRSKDDKIILALAHMSDADYEEAVAIWEDLISTSLDTDPESPMLKQNCAVCNLYLGRLDEARTHLETLIEASANFHALTFNLSTIYELCTERSRVLKIGLAEKVAEMQIEGLGSDGAEEGAEGGSGKSGWEKVNGDFKL